MGDMYKVFTIKGDDDTLTFFEEVTFAIHEMHDGWQDEIPTKHLWPTRYVYEGLLCDQRRQRTRCAPSQRQSFLHSSGRGVPED